MQQQPFECAKRAGLGCVTVGNSLETASGLRRIVDPAPLPFDRTGCNSYRLDLMSKANEERFK